MFTLTQAHFASPITPAAALDWCTLYQGAVHRLAWQGEDDPGDRRRCLKRLTERLSQAWSADPEELVAITLTDWWLTAVGLEGPAGVAWRPEVHIADTGLTTVLRSVLECGGLRVLERPRRFAASRKKLEELLLHVPRIKKQVGQDIYAEAKEEAYSVLHAAEAGAKAPPGDLRLLKDDIEDWATEVRATDRLQRHLKVWNSVVKHLTTLRGAVVAVVDSWTTASFEPLDLDLDPPTWARQHCPSHARLAAGCLAELATLSGTGAPQALATLTPEAVVQTLMEIPDKLELELKVAMLALIREAAAAGGALSIPSWAREAEEHLEGVRTTIRSLRVQAEAVGAEESVQSLGAALDELEQLRIGEAETWIQYAEESLQQHAHDAEASKLTRELASWIADLEESAYGDMGSLAAREGEPLPGRHERVRSAWEQHRDNLRVALDRLDVRTRGGGAGGDLQARITEARTALSQNKLGPAKRHLDGAEALAEARRKEAEDKLRPELKALFDRVGSLRGLTPGERHMLGEIIARATDRADEELPFEHLTSDIEHFISECEGGRLEVQPLLCAVGELAGLERNRRVTPVAWHPVGLGIDPQRLAPNGYRLLTAEHAGDHQTGDLVVVHPQKTWTEPLRVELPLASAPQTPPEGRWYDIITTHSLEGAELEELRAYPGRHDLSDHVFIEAEGMVQGPYAASEDTEQLVPADERGFVARLDAEQFEALFGRFHVAMGSAGQGRIVTPLPPDLDTLLLQDAEPWDSMDGAHIEVWLAGLLADVDHSRVAALSSALARLQSSGEMLPGPILDQRLTRLGGLLETSRHLDQERNRAAQAFLETEEGQREIRRAAERRAEAELAAIKRAVDAKRQDLEAALASRQYELAQAQDRLDTLQQEEHSKRDALQLRLADLRSQVKDLEEVAVDTRTRVLASLLGEANNGGSSQPAPATIATEPVLANPFEHRAITSLHELSTELTRDLSPWSDRQIANLLISLITCPWILLAGPPGVGKSTFVRSMLTRLGHGPGTDRYLELVVRRDWQDDAPLFGYWHPERHHWEPSSEGFLEQLLRADNDRQRELGGLFPFVLEEMNLAAPEHYLARPISALEDSQPTIRLYGDTQHPANLARYPANFPVGDNVRLLGTVNLDDTVERLSPRFLSRAAVIWMSPSLDALMQQAPIITPPEQSVDWRQLRSLSERPPGELGELHRVVRYLHEQRVPGAPSPRTMRAMERYLAVAPDLLTSRVAQDFQVLQRILPCVRGVGERYRRIFDDLAALLRTHQWSMSAERCEELRARGEELGDYYDFFHV
mgnify:CR=1 FL=1